MDASVLLLLLVLACPVAMFFMMRGGHGAHGHAGPAASTETLEDLRRRRDELDRELAARERR